MLKPKLFTTLKNYTLKQFLADLSAGTIVGIVALPLAIAFGIASGVTPEKGLITAIIAGFIISFLGGSRVQIGGPTGAFIVIVYGIVILVIMGFARFGSVIKFIPHPVVVGFTSGIALLIFSTQIKDFFGLAIDKVPSEFFDKWIEYSFNFSTINYYAFGTAVLALFTIMIPSCRNNRIKVWRTAICTSLSCFSTNRFCSYQKSYWTCNYDSNSCSN